jgi:hypothetical protein
MTIKYDNTCELYCVDTEINQQAEVLNYDLEKRLTVAIAGNKIVLQWKESIGRYAGKLAGLDFLSDGPKTYNVRTTR